jgi:hypothetical protein
MKKTRLLCTLSFLLRCRDHNTIILKMEAIRPSETSGTTLRTTRRHIPEDDTLRVSLIFTFVCRRLEGKRFWREW